MARNTQYNKISADTSRGPSGRIWGDCPVLEIIADPGVGVYMFDDFLSFGGYSDAAEVGGYMVTTTNGTVHAAADTNFGALFIDAVDADNDETFVMVGDETPCFTTLSDTAGANYPFWYETRVKYTFTGLFAGYVGMINPSGSADDLLPDAGTGMISTDHLGFNALEGTDGSLDAVHNNAAADVGTVLDDGAHILVTNTWVKLGLFYNGTAVYWYVNGVPVTPDTATDHVDGIGQLPAATDMPDAKDLAPFWGVKAHVATEVNMHIDWWRFASLCDAGTIRGGLG